MFAFYHKSAFFYSPLSPIFTILNAQIAQESFDTFFNSCMCLFLYLCTRFKTRTKKKNEFPWHTLNLPRF